MGWLRLLIVALPGSFYYVSRSKRDVHALRMIFNLDRAAIAG